ncbi:UNKNOWN [Stylonychia lemnae]|uniref:Uncharacterized protein n=1 Tax=Stylonychia lemnae TaxID=5949 RepID=A0A078B2A9_STYLE|nr:UNKNOWN [Stylonychia lemnae]|eukprot:CDW88624.1 UNKNOWN [Stylonychia lemnae]
MEELNSDPMITAQANDAYLNQSQTEYSCKVDETNGQSPACLIANDNAVDKEMPQVLIILLSNISFISLNLSLYQLNYDLLTYGSCFISGNEQSIKVEIKAIKVHKKKRYYQGKYPSIKALIMLDKKNEMNMNHTSEQSDKYFPQATHKIEAATPIKILQKITTPATRFAIEVIPQQNIHKAYKVEEIIIDFLSPNLITILEEKKELNPNTMYRVDKLQQPRLLNPHSFRAFDATFAEAAKSK